MPDFFSGFYFLVKFMKKTYFKYISFLILTLFLYLFSDVWSEFKDFRQSNIEYKNSVENSISKTSEFDLNNLKELENTEIYYTPYLPLIDKIVDKIDSAKNKVYLESYILTEKSIKKALINAKNRWIDVKVILEQNVYKAEYLNNDAYNELKDAWVNVVRDWTNYALTHTKMMIIDDEIIISTWNYSYSSFKTNREFFIFTKDKEINEKLNLLFWYDFEWKKWIVYDNELIISPYYSREKLHKLISSAKNEIKFYAQNFSDYEILDDLILASKSWIKVSWIISWKDDLWNSDEILKMKNAWINIYDLNSPYIHAKALLIDWKYLYVWSINYSYYSIEKNREVWLLIINNDIISKFLKAFEKDVKKFVKNR